MSNLTRRTTLGALASAPLAAPFITPMAAQALPVGAPAPEWDISEWMNSEPFSLADMKGRVVVIDFFQLWCPGCNNFSIPLTKEWEKKYAGAIAEERMQLVSIHTVFEGLDHQNPKRLRRFMEKKGFGHPVGVDRHGIHPHFPHTMILSGTRGTPEMAVIDPDGRIAFQQFGYFEVPAVERLIDGML